MKPFQYLTFITLCLVLAACTNQNKSNPTDEDRLPLENEHSSTKVTKPEYGFGSGFLDSKGTMWFGSRGDGIYKYDGTSFTNYTEDDGLVDNDISCIAEDSKGNLLFGTNNGLCIYDGKSFSHLAIPQSDTSSSWLDKVYPIVNPNQVMSILEDSHGSLWIGTNGAGVYRYDGETFEHLLSDIGMVYEDGQTHNIVLSIIEDLSGNIWFSSLSHAGVSRFDGKSFTHFTSELSDDFIRVVYPDLKGNVWIGTHGNHNGGFDKYDGVKFTRFYKTDDGMFHNNVVSIYEDNQGKLWLGSGVTEMSTFDGRHFEVFTDSQGQTFDKMIFVVGDKDGNIWFGNRDGLWKYNGEDVEDMILTI